MKKQALDSLVVSALSAVSLGTAVLLYRVVTRRFGPAETDAFFLALGVLNVLIVPAYNAISSTLVPTLVRRTARGSGDVPLLLGATVCWTACVSLTATVCIAIFAFRGLRMFASVPIATAQLAAHDMVILGPLITFQAVGAVVAAASQAGARYWAPAAASLCQQALTTALLARGLPISDTVVLPLAFTIGGLAYLLVLVVVWPWHKVRMRPSLSVPKDLVASARLAVPLVYGTIAIQLGFVGLRLFASRLAPGAVTAFDLAYRVAIALVEVCAGGLLAVTLTRWSAAVTAGEGDSLRARLRDTLGLALFVILPLPVLLHALRAPLVTLWLSASATTTAIAAMTIAALGIFLLGVPMDIAGRLYTRVLIAKERTPVLGWLALQRMFMTLVLGAILVVPLGIQGVVLSDTLAILITLVCLHGITTGSWGWGRELGKGSLPRLIFAASLSWVAAKLVASTSALPGLWLRSGIGAVSGLVTYLVLVRALKVPEFTTVKGLFKGDRPPTAQPQTVAGNAEM